MLRLPWMELVRASLLLAAATILLPVQTTVADTLTSTLERIRVLETRHFSYLETRHMQLLAKPWQATGDMYISPRKMVIAQQTPKVVVTVITTDHMLHIDEEQNIYRSLKLKQAFAMPGMKPLMLLLYGAAGRAELEQEYTLSLDTMGQRWILELVPRQQTEYDIIRTQLSGNKDRGPDHLMLENEDGDRTNWQLSILSQGAPAMQEMQQLLDRFSLR